MQDSIKQALDKIDRSIESSGFPEAAYYERMLLGSILLGTVKVEDLDSDLSADSFTLEKHRRIFRAVQDVHEKNGPVNNVTVAQYLHDAQQIASIDGLTYLTELTDNIPHIHNIDHYVDKLVIRHKATSFVGQVLHEVNQILTGHELDGAQERIVQAAQVQVRKRMDAGKMPDAFTIVGDRFQDLFGTQPPGVMSGLLPLDELTNGFRPGELIIIGARPADGKTALLQQIASHAVRSTGKNVHLVSLEMSKENLLQRMVCQLASIPFHEVRAGGISPQEDHQIATAFHELSQNSRLRIDDSVDWTLRKLEAHLKYYSRTSQPVDLLGIDYLQLMPLDGKGRQDRRDLEIGSLTRGFKLLSKQYRLPIVVLSQLSRDGEKMNRKPNKADLRDSGNIEADADVILLLWHNKQKDYDLMREAELILEKQRNGPVGTIPVWFDKRSVAFTKR